MRKKFLTKPGFMTIMALLFMALSLPGGVFAAEKNAAKNAHEPIAAIRDAAVAVATVVKVNPETREVTLRADDKEFTFTAGPEVRNFDQIKRGDLLLTQYYSAFAIAVKPAHGGKVDRTNKIVVSRAQKGDRPAASIQHTITAQGVIKAIDKKHRKVTVKGPENTLVLKVSKDVDLSKLKVGDLVDATYVSFYSVAVEPAPKVSGKVKIKATSVAAGIGVEWGKGTLTMYDGSVHTFKISGISIVDVGISTIQAEGDVYHLVEAKDLSGTYLSGQTGATFIAGGSVTAMKNDKGVVLKLKSTQKGLKLTLAPGGMKISDVK